MKSKRTITFAKFGRPGVIFEEEDAVQLLRAAVGKDGSQAAWARRHGIERTNVNAMLSGKKPVCKPVANALGLRRTYTTK
jgi:hypothetical protein